MVGVGIVHPGALNIGLVHWIVGGTFPDGWQLIDAVADSAAQLVRRRNMIVERFLATRTLHWLLFIDADESPELDLIPKLLEGTTPAQIIGGPVLERQDPFRVAAFTSLDPVTRVYASALQHMKHRVEMAAIGTGCMLLSRAVLERMTPRWFRVGEFESDLLSEDLGFCRRAVRETDVTIWLDPHIDIGHDLWGASIYYDRRYGRAAIRTSGRPRSWAIPVPEAMAF
jgi:hypothetical protein